jgi:hypothetical protein
MRWGQEGEDHEKQEGLEHGEPPRPGYTISSRSILKEKQNDHHQDTKKSKGQLPLQFLVSWCLGGECLIRGIEERTYFAMTFTISSTLQE